MEVAQYHVLSRVLLSTVVTFRVLLPVNVINGKASKEIVSIDFFNKNLGPRSTSLYSCRAHLKVRNYRNQLQDRYGHFLARS